MNHLQFESSPYLLQHAHNPVDWYPWGEAAFERARNEDKPILVSVGYAACHWCHVMERESFENEETAGFMNVHFINIKIDREERPDLDNIFMNACQILTGAGGWPLHVFLTPDHKPFHAGTYFPPKPGYGKPSWMQLLKYMHEVFVTERDKVEDQAEKLSMHIVQMDRAFIQPMPLSETEPLFTEKDFALAVAGIRKQFDEVDGGFGNAPKFPGAMSLRFLMRYAYHTGNEQIWAHVHLSLKKMHQGGIYDHVGGGFSRYAVDKKWMIPHFEKMLYDNALLAATYAEAYRITRNELYMQVCADILQFAERDMHLPSGGFIASYDADSEGVEGKYYTFSYQEFKEVTGDDHTWALDYFQVEEAGNWEHTNILHVHADEQQLAESQGWSLDVCREHLSRVKKKLLDHRSKRIAPGADHKMILCWNALMCSAYVEAFKASANPHYRNMAVETIQVILDQFVIDPQDAKLWHTLTHGVGKYHAVLEDYAACIQALLDVYDITGNMLYVNKAIQYTTHVQTHFSAADGMYFFTAGYQHDVPVRATEFYDNATPSGNSMMLHNMQRLYCHTARTTYAEQAEAMCNAMKKSMLQYGTSFGNWLMAAYTYSTPYHEIVITGDQADTYRDALITHYFPYAVYATDTTGDAPTILTENRYVPGATMIYHCRNFTCARPVSSVQDFVQALEEL